MSKLYIPIGPPGCGKSSLAWHLVILGNLDPKAIVSPDEYRGILTGSVSDQSANPVVFDICHDITRSRLARKLDVFFDATNVTDRALNGLVDISKQYDADVTKIGFPIPLEECLANNASRDRQVPDFLVERMWGQAQGQSFDITAKEFEEQFVGASLVG